VRFEKGDGQMLVLGVACKNKTLPTNSALELKNVHSKSVGSATWALLH